MERILKRPELASEELELWASLIESRCGLVFTESRGHLLCRCLWERARCHGLWSYRDYHAFLLRPEAGEEEWSQLVELLVNGETSFFRHPPSYRALRDVILPAVTTRRPDPDDGRLKLWSAGCATGEEAYSMAMVAHDPVLTEGLDLIVHATDISSRMVAATRAARYRARKLAAVPFNLRRRYFAADPESQDDFRVVSELRQRLVAGRLNLASDEPYRFRGQDVIFCQNLFIYLQPRARFTVLQRLGESLRQGGFLVLAPGEMVRSHLPWLALQPIPDCLVFRRDR